MSVWDAKTLSNEPGVQVPNVEVRDQFVIDGTESRDWISLD